MYQELNYELTQNNSQEQLVIIGPSMGGQISRYALAYMEEHNIPHNTRLWVSVDSPHLGANIPIGTQTMLHLLKDKGDSSEARDFVDNELGSVAAKQQLIEQYKDNIGDQVGQEWLNAKTISQNYNESRGHPFFQEYYNNLYGNGLTGSNGYPQNLRKIAIVNGSLKNVKNFKNPYQPLGTGFTSPYNDVYPADGSQTLKMRGKANVLGHIVTMESYFLPSVGANHKIAYFKKWSFNWSYYDRFVTNNNSRGNLDNLPGGWYPTQRDLAYTVEGSTPCKKFIGHICVNTWYIDKLKHVNSFIPTVSALGIYNPDFNWAHTFDRNLVCTGEIPFDNYFGPKENEQHVYFTEKSVAWLLAELDENPQPPTIYLDENNMSGPSFICSSDTATYSFGNCESAPILEWEVSNNLQIVISPAQNHSVKVKPKNTSSNGLAFIKAIFDNPNEPVKKNIWIGKPNYNFDLQWDEVSRRLNITIVDDNLDLQEITNVNWEVIGSTNGGIIQNCSGFECHARGPLHNIWTVDLKVTVSNSCGTTIEYLTATPPPPIAKSDPIYYEFIGQGDNIYTVNFVEDHISNPINRQQNFPKDLKIFVYDFTGNLVQQTQEEIIDISSLKSGFYIFKVYIDREILTKKVIKI